MEKLETELATLRARAETLASRHAAADAAFLEAKSKLQRYHLEADLDADDKVRSKMEAAVATFAVTRDGLADAIGEVRKLIGETEQKIAAERAAAERKAASEELARNLDAVERTLPEYLAASCRFVTALETLHQHFETTEIARFVATGTAQVEVAAAFALQELHRMVGAIRSGSAPIPVPKAAAEPVMAVETPPPTMTVWLLHSVKYRDNAGMVRLTRQFEDAEMPMETAQRGPASRRCGAGNRSASTRPQRSARRRSRRSECTRHCRSRCG